MGAFFEHGWPEKGERRTSMRSKNSEWYKKAYRRNVVDMHIPDWSKEFLSKFDPWSYVRLLKLSQAQSAVVYLHSHAGLCYYPTKVGKMHEGLNGRNIFKEVLDECHRNDIAVVAYFSLIYDCWAYDNHPDWRIIRPDGKEAAIDNRYGVCCPNAPGYRKYVAACIREICSNYDIEGIRFDMTFWPQVCYCPNCQRRFEEEVGGEIPRIIDWTDPKWVSFQRKREEWLCEFAALATSTVKQCNPEVSVEHQSSTYPSNWRFGVSHELAEENDFLQGDFYGDALQGSFVRKLFYNLTKNRPYGFETSFNVSLRNHTAKKSKDLLANKVYACLGDGGAFVFIDAIDPVGTLNESVYRRMNGVFDEAKKYEQFIGGKMCQDIAIYLSTESKCDFADNGKAITAGSLSHRIPHVDGCVNVCKTLIDNHIPFGVITKRNLADLSRHKVIVLPNVLMMDQEEIEAFRDYVVSGGSLYASKYTSLVTKAGLKMDDFLLGDVFGVSYLGQTKESFTYMAPTGDGNLFPDYSWEYPLGIPGPQLKLEAAPSTKVLAQVVLPYTDPSDPKKFASIHSNPPGRYTDYPAIVFNKYGSGKVIYAAADLENYDTHRDSFMKLIDMLLPEPPTFQVDAPKSVEATMFHQQAEGRSILNLVNFQKELPNIPIDGIRVRVRMDGPVPKRVVVLPERKEVDCWREGGYLEFTAPRLETYLMLAIEY